MLDLDHASRPVITPVRLGSIPQRGARSQATCIEVGGYVVYVRRRDRARIGHATSCVMEPLQLAQFIAIATYDPSSGVSNRRKCSRIIVVPQQCETAKEWGNRGREAPSFSYRPA